MTKDQKIARLEAAVRIGLNGLLYGHEVCCGGQPGNMFSHSMADIQELTGMFPSLGGPVELESPADIYEAVARRVA